MEAKDQHGQTPLYWALKNGHQEIAKLLLVSGADIEAENKDGKTPLHLALQAGHLETVKLLLERGELRQNFQGLKIIQLAISFKANESWDSPISELFQTGAHSILLTSST